MIILQLILFCAIFTALVRFAVRGGAKVGLYFYPKDYQAIAYQRGIDDPDDVARRRKRFMPIFFLSMTIALVAIIAAWNRVHDFKTAYWQALLFLEVMNWFDGIVIDRLWVGHSAFWVIPGMEGVPYLQTWPQVIKKRLILTAIWVAGAAIIAGLVVLVGRLL